MGTWTKEEAAASLRQLQELGAEAERLSAVPLTEEEGRRVRSRLATCSLPVSLVQEIAELLACASSNYRAQLLHNHASRLDAKRADLIIRAQMALSESRQPRENVADEPRSLK